MCSLKPTAMGAAFYFLLTYCMSRKGMSLTCNAGRMQLSEEFNVAVVITNHVVSDPSGGAVFVADPKKPVGGHVLAHACTIRLSLRKGKGEQRLMKVVDAPNLRERPLCIRPACDQGLCLMVPGHVRTASEQAEWTADYCQAHDCMSSARPLGTTIHTSYGSAQHIDQCLVHVRTPYISKLLGEGYNRETSCCGNHAAEAEASFQLSTEGIIDYKD